MAGCRMWHLFNKEAITIILWYVPCIFGYISVFQSVPWPGDHSVSGNNAIVLALVYGSTIILYSFLGLFADVFIGRYRLIQFSLRVQWIVVLLSTFITALQSEYKFPTWLLFSIMYVIEMVGLSTFQRLWPYNLSLINSKGPQVKSSASAFVYWYFMTERYQWIYYKGLWIIGFLTVNA